MKKICVALMLLILTGTASFGAVSDDVYLRKDVFEVYMKNINANTERILQKLDRIDENLSTLNQAVANLSGRVDGLDKRIDALDKRIDGLDKRIDGLDKRIDGVDKRIDGVNVSLSARIDDLRNGIYLGLVALGLFISWPKAKETLQKLGKSTPSITLEDVKRLIEEHDAELRKSLQV